MKQLQHQIAHSLNLYTVVSIPMSIRDQELFASMDDDTLGLWLDLSITNRSFDVTAPGKKMDFSATSTTTCDNYGEKASLRCARCPPSDRTYYCSKECQKEDWKKWHKKFCANKRFYALTRDIDFKDVSLENLDPAMLAQYRKARDETGLLAQSWYFKYLRDVSLTQRPVTMLGEPAQLGWMSDGIKVAMQKLASTTPEEHQARTEQLTDTAYKDVDPADIPFEDRQCASKKEDGSPKRGIEMFWSDFDTIPPAMFRCLWARDIVFTVDPWDPNVQQGATKVGEKSVLVDVSGPVPEFVVLK